MTASPTRKIYVNLLQRFEGMRLPQSMGSRLAWVERRLPSRRVPPVVSLPAAPGAAARSDVHAGGREGGDLG